MIAPNVITVHHLDDTNYSSCDPNHDFDDTNHDIYDIDRCIKDLKSYVMLTIAFTRFMIPLIGDTKHWQQHDLAEATHWAEHHDSNHCIGVLQHKIG